MQETREPVPYIIDEILHNESYTYESLRRHLEKNPDDIYELKKALVQDAQ